MATSVDVKKLLEAGAHFGHKTSRWHPKMAPYIHSKRDGIHVIDLVQTAAQLENALAFIEKTAASGKQVLFVGTKRQAQKAVKTAAEELSMPYVVNRWLGGMLTNRATMNGRIKHLKTLEEKMESGALASKYSKLEVQRYQEEIDHMNHLYGGIKYMAAKPGAMFVTDVLHDVNAVREAKRLGIPVVGIVDTNANPDEIDYPVPANDDAIKTIQLMTEYVAAAVAAGRAKIKKEAPTEKPQDEKTSEATK
jgi:small subunit ribosomal protein S2